MIQRLRSLAHTIQLMRSRKGPYRFVVRRWAGLSDIDLAANVLGTEFFRNELQPVALPIDRIRSILVLAPHQDDETIGAGGTLLKASAAGAKIDVLYITDGASDSRSKEWVDLRRAEAKTVCDAFGATMRELGIYNPRPEPSAQHLEQLSALCWELRPQVILSPWLLDSPPRHRLVNHLLWLAHQRDRLPECEIWGYQVHNSLLPNGYVDITDVADRKRELLECFRSQNENWTSYTHLAMGLAAWNAHFIRSTTPRYLEVFTTLPMSEFLELIESFYFKDLHQTYRGDSVVLKCISGLHRAVTGAKAG